MKIQNFKFYEIDKDYIKYLKIFDDKVPNVEYDTNNKFLCGIIFKKNDFYFFVPVSSFKIKQQTNFLIKNDNNVVGSLRFCFMIPIPISQFKKILWEKDFEKENEKYKNLLNKELQFVNSNKIEIIEHAKRVYNLANKQIAFYTKNCCNFALLEEKSKLYVPKN